MGANERTRYQQSVFTDLVRTVNGRLPVIGIASNEDDMADTLLGQPTSMYPMKVERVC